MKTKSLLISLALGLGLSMALLWMVGGGRTPSALAIVEQSGAEGMLAPAGELRVCPAGPPTCDYATVQAAVDAASPGDVIKVATGVYTGINNYGGTNQVVYISKTLAIRGGYTTTDWIISNPVSYPTTLDAQNGGRVIFIRDATVTIEGLRLMGGSALDYFADYGGGIFAYNSALTLQDNVILSNTAAYYGGGVYAGDSTVTLTGNTVTSNTSICYSCGGGVSLYSSIATLTGNTFSGNHGSGVYVRSGNVTLDENTFTANTAGFGGALLMEYGGIITLTHNTFVANTATDSHYGGGGVYMACDYATITANTFQSNTTNAGGGGLALWGNATLRDNTFIGNRANAGSGGGACLTGGGVQNAYGNTFTGNSVNGDGGGLAVVGSYGGRIERNIITDNSASMRGGGLAINTSYNVIFNANTIVSNTAGWHGGGVSLYGRNYELLNTVIADNRAAIHGSGVYVYEASPSLIHTTLARNSGGDGSAVYGEASGGGSNSILMTNTLIYSHSLGAVNTAGVVTLTMTLWDSVLTPTQGMVTDIWGFTGTAALAADGYHLTAASDALDAALDTGVSDDIDGQPRPMGPFADIGADEYPYTADLGLTKARQGSGPVDAGRPITFTLTLSNSPGSEWAADARIVDTLSPASAVAALSGSAPGGACQAAGAVITCTVNNVPTTTLTLVTVRVTTTAGYNGVLTNTAAVTPTDAIDLNPANNAAGPVTVTIVYVPPAPDLWVNKAVSQRYIQPGHTLVYTVAWGNMGALAAANVILTDTLPPDVTFGSASGNPTRNGQVLTWNLGSAAPGAGNTYTVSVQVNGDLPDGSVLTNTARITTTTAGDPPLNNTAVATTTVYDTGGVILWMSKEASDQRVSVEGIINYTIRVNNVGEVGAVIQLADAIPAGTEYWGVASTPAGVQYEPGSNRITWNGNLDKGQSLTIDLAVKVVYCAGAECGLVRNTAEVRVPGISYVWQASADVLVQCPDLQVTLTAPRYVYGNWPTEYELTLDYRNNRLVDPWGDHSLEATPYISLTLAADEGTAHFLEATPAPDRIVNDRQWEWNLNQLNPGDAGQIQITVRKQTYSNSGYTVRAGIMDRSEPECLCNLVNNAAQKTTYPVEVSFGKYHESNPVPVWTPAPGGGMELRFLLRYVMPYSYENANPNPHAIESLRIDDAWPAVLRYVNQSSSPQMYFEQVNATHLLWEKFPAQFWEGSRGWVRVEGKTNRPLTPTAQVVNQATLTYRLSDEQDQQMRREATDEIPLIAPFIAKPNAPGQINLCPGNVNIVGVGQPGVQIRLFNNGINVYTGTTDAQGNFNLAGSLSAPGVNHMHTTAVYGGQQSNNSNAVTLRVDNTLHWDPYRSYWEGDVKAGPLQGQHMRFGFLDANGNYTTTNWQMPGVYGFWDTDLYLYTCGCPDPVHETQVVTITADGKDYSPLDWNGNVAHFRIGGAHNVKVTSKCVNTQTGQTTSTSTGDGQVLIDPDGYVFNVDRGGDYSGPGGMFNPVQPVSGVTVTCMVSMPQWGGWVPWPAHVYGQTNPQVTDAAYPDGITTTGYFAFFTPPGHYYLQVEGIPGYQEWRSPVVEVITQIVHVNVPYTPWPAAATTVTLTADGPEPAVITVPVGGAVEWVSTIRASDTITDLLNWFENPILRPLSDLDPLRDTRGFDAGYLEPGRVYRRQFRVPGRYAYTDADGHSGVVIVEGPTIYLPIVLRLHAP